MADEDFFDIPTKGFSFGAGGLDRSGLDFAAMPQFFSDVSAPSSGGNWYDSILGGLGKIKDFAVGPAGDQKDYGALGVLGNISKAVAPIAGIGGSILGAINSRDVAQQAVKQSKIAEDAQRTQIRSAEKGQELAPQAAALSPKIEALAPRFASLSGRAETDIANPQIDYGKRLLAMASAGTLDPADAAAIEEWKQKQIAQWQDYFGRSGQGNSETLQAKMDEIEKQAVAARSETLKGYRTTAQQYLQGGGAGLAESGTLAQAEGADLALADQPLSAAGNILAASSGAAGAAGTSARAEEQSLEQLLASTEAMLKKLAAMAA